MNDMGRYTASSMFFEDRELEPEELEMLLRLILIEGKTYRGRNFLVEVIAFSLFSINLNPYIVQSFVESQNIEADKIKIYET
jgi:hypothetical protein